MYDISPAWPAIGETRQAAVRIWERYESVTSDVSWQQAYGNGVVNKRKFKPVHIIK